MHAFPAQPRARPPPRQQVVMQVRMRPMNSAHVGSERPYPSPRSCNVSLYAILEDEPPENFPQPEIHSVPGRPVLKSDDVAVPGRTCIERSGGGGGKAVEIGR